MSWSMLAPFAASWDELNEAFDWVRRLRGCPQDPKYHAEGDVWIHTRMVLDALNDMSAFTELSPPDQHVVYTACLLHDVAKPECTKEEDGRITSRGHSGRGELRARRLLWEMTAPLRPREHVAQLVRFHQLPFFLIDQADAVRRLHYLSQVLSPRLLAVVAEADARGRHSDSQSRLLTNIELFRTLAEDEGCFDRPFPFANDHTRVEYFRRPGRAADYAAHDSTTFEVVVLSGLPGAGKDTWCDGHQGEVVSLDDIRRRLGIDPTDGQARVIDEARQQARRLLRSRTPFVWNATNLSRQLRGSILSLVFDYRGRARVEYLEPPSDVLHRQNRERADAVPDAVILRMMERWRVPDRTEAHAVNWNGRPAGWLAAPDSSALSGRPRPE